MVACTVLTPYRMPLFAAAASYMQMTSQVDFVHARDTPWQSLWHEYILPNMVIDTAKFSNLLVQHRSQPLRAVERSTGYAQGCCSKPHTASIQSTLVCKPRLKDALMGV